MDLREHSLVDAEDLELRRHLSLDLWMLSARLARAGVRVASTGMSATLYRLLVLIAETEPITIGDLAELDHCSQPTMSAAVKRLVECRWVVKQTLPNDRRFAHVRVTALGHDELEQTRKRAADLIVGRLDVGSRFTTEDLRGCVAVLNATLESIDRLELNS